MLFLSRKKISNFAPWPWKHHVPCSPYPYPFFPPIQPGKMPVVGEAGKLGETLSVKKTQGLEWVGFLMEDA